MKIRVASSLIGLALLSTLSGCAAMLPIAGALVLKEAADRYEAANKPPESKPAPADTTVASVPDTAVPEVEPEEQAAPAPVATRVASTTSKKPPLSAPAKPAPIASAEPDSSDSERPLSPTDEPLKVASIPSAAHDEEYTDEEIAASQRPLNAAPVRNNSPQTPVKAVPKTVSGNPPKPTLAPNKTGTAQAKSDPAAQKANQKAQEVVKTANSIPTTEAAANDSATDSAARILATALKKIPNPQAIPATKPAPIIPQKNN
ncbi:MAG: hypothetical protein JNK16_01035 [Phycisphaerales bacterium]|nr:hypothetical protein [Phycisphaerales bacterium]